MKPDTIDITIETEDHLLDTYYTDNMDLIRKYFDKYDFAPTEEGEYTQLQNEEIIHLFACITQDISTITIDNMTEQEENLQDLHLFLLDAIRDMDFKKQVTLSYEEKEEEGELVGTVPVYHMTRNGEYTQINGGQ